MSEQAPGGAQRIEAEPGACERSLELHGFVFQAPHGWGGGQRAVRPGTSRSESEGAWTDGREWGVGGGETNFLIVLSECTL